MLKELFEITPDTLAQKQHDALKTAVVDHLTQVTELLKQERYEVVKKQLAYSPAGDGYGCNNHFIDFSHIMEPIFGSNAPEGWDLETVAVKLEHLANHAKKSLPPDEGQLVNKMPF